MVLSLYGIIPPPLLPKSRYWKDRPEKPDGRRAVLRSQVLELHGISHGSAGARSIATMATRRGYQMGRWLAGRLMKELVLVSCQQPTHRYKRGGHEHVAIPDYPERQFAVTGPNQVWCGDVTYIWTGTLTAKLLAFSFGIVELSLHIAVTAAFADDPVAQKDKTVIDMGDSGILNK